MKPREIDTLEPSGQKYVVARADDIPPGERRIVRARGRSYGVFNVDGTFYALLNRCPHQGGDLCKGPLQTFVDADAPGRVRFDRSRSFVQCPWHGWEFDLRTGQSYADPARTRVRSYPVDVRSADGLAGGSGANGVARTEQEPTVPGGVHKTVVSGRTAGPFTAETVPVSVEAEYVVLILPR
jgi:3-phenylpropionate/trans-cinnamate dioxygenase ferredoxin subunit